MGKLDAKEGLDEMFNAAAMANSYWKIILTEMNCIAHLKFNVYSQFVKLLFSYNNA